MAARKECKSISQREIGVILNNAVSAASNSQATYRQSDERKRKLRQYTLTLCQYLLEDVDAEPPYLSAEELVQVLTGAALFVHSSRVMNNLKLPMIQDMMKRELEDASDVCEL